MGECEGWADAFKGAQVPENHRGLTWSEAEDSLVGLTPFLFEEARAGRGVRARRALVDVSAERKRKVSSRTHAFVFFGDLDQAELQYSLKEPGTTVGKDASQ